MSATATTGAHSLRAATLELNTNMTTPAWQDISGTFIEIASTGGELPTEDTHVASAMAPRVTVGKPGSKTLTITLIHSEVAGDGPTLVKAAEYLAAQFRWTTRGNVIGNTRWTTDAGYILHVSDPVGNVGAAGSARRIVTFTCISITPAAITV